MGYVKSQQMHFEDVGYLTKVDTKVCKRHFTDGAIIEFIEANQEQDKCDYCKSVIQIEGVVHLEILLKFLYNGINYFYANADDEGVSYDSSEGGYQGANVFNTEELLRDEIELDVKPETLFQDILNSIFDKPWCTKNPYNFNEHEKLIYEWNRFSDLVKHKIRYTFFITSFFETESRKKIAGILEDIVKGVEALSLKKDLSIGTKIFRSRQHKNSDSISKLDQITSPPIEYATFPNRMSPSGISMFYGAFDIVTSKLETIDNALINEMTKVSVGTF